MPCIEHSQHKLSQGAIVTSSSNAREKSTLPKRAMEVFDAVQSQNAEPAVVSNGALQIHEFCSNDHAVPCGGSCDDDLAYVGSPQLPLTESNADVVRDLRPSSSTGSSLPHVVETTMDVAWQLRPSAGTWLLPAPVPEFCPCYRVGSREYVPTYDLLDSGSYGYHGVLDADDIDQLQHLMCIDNYFVQYSFSETRL